MCDEAFSYNFKSKIYTEPQIFDLFYILPFYNYFKNMNEQNE